MNYMFFCRPLKRHNDANQYKVALFTPRIIAFNESFVPVGTKQHLSPIAVIWHEGIEGKKKRTQYAHPMLKKKIEMQKRLFSGWTIVQHKIKIGRCFPT